MQTVSTIVFGTHVLGHSAVTAVIALRAIGQERS